MKVQTKIRGITYRISGNINEVAEKVSKLCEFNVNAEDIVSQGIWSVVYRHDYALKRPRKNPAGESVPVQEL